MINAMDFIFTTQYKLGIDFINNAKRPYDKFVSHNWVPLEKKVRLNSRFDGKSEAFIKC